MKRRERAEIALALVDADIARHYVYDGQLSDEPLGGRCDEELRARRLEAVAELERAGGRDPHPSFTRPPTAAQRAGWERRNP